jgi:hypothetical protein
MIFAYVMWINLSVCVTKKKPNPEKSGDGKLRVLIFSLSFF